MSRNLEPPVLLNSARVVLYADTVGGTSYTGRRVVLVGGKPLDPSPRLAICEDLVEDAFLLMHCDTSWNVLAASYYPSIDAAKASAEDAHAGISSKWFEHRSLTDEERREIAELRQSLRLLAAEHPIDRDPHGA
jgi:hypothetical protein